jgi:VanZ family protein
MTPHPPARRWPGRRTFSAGLAASVLFAIYGSLVPFDLVRVPLDEAMHRFASAMEGPLQLWSRSDLIANVLLMIPVAFCLMAVCRLDRRGMGGTLAAAMVTVAGGYGLANLLEFLQVFTPDRVVSKSDVVAQTIGAVIGVGGWLFAGQPMIDWLRGASRPRHGVPAGGGLDDQWRRVQALLAVYAAGWFILMALPLELTISPGALVHKLRTGGIILVPFTGQYESFSDGLWDVLGGALSAAPLGILAWLTALDWRWRSRVTGALLLGWAFVCAGEFVQVFEIHRVADVTDVIIGCVGVATSVWLATRRLRVATAPTPTTSTARGARPVAGARGRVSGSPAFSTAAPGASWAAALAQTLAWCAVLVFYHWKPFDFTTDAHLIRERVRDLSLMPLAQYVHASTGPQLLMQMLVKGGLGVPLGALLARWIRTWGLTTGSSGGSRLAWVAGLTLALGILGGIEVGQIFLPDRVADITDVLVAWCGAASGMALVLHGPLAQQSFTNREAYDA